jgi:capsular exopolysaccharide synthesis family protein
MVFVFESLDTSIKTSEDIKRFTDHSVLGNIPRIKTDVNGHLSIFDPGKRPTKNEINQLITLYENRSHAAEAFRMLRTNLQFSSSDFRSNSVLITSPQPGEGKSTTAINLAITTAQLGYNTLLVDADLRRPVLHKVFKVDREPGLVDILYSNSFQNFMTEHFSASKKNLLEDFFVADNSSDLDSMTNEPYNYLIKEHKFDFESLSNLYSEIEKAVKPLSNIEHLSLLTTGSAVENTSEVLGSKITRTLISLVKKKYDVIIIDSPPVLVVTDTSILASIVDGVLLVCIAGKAHQRTVNRAIELLEKGDTKIWGIVLNQSMEEYIPQSYKRYYKAKA